MAHSGDDEDASQTAAALTAAAGADDAGGRADGERTSLASSISRVSAVRLPQVRRPGQEGLRVQKPRIFR